MLADVIRDRLAEPEFRPFTLVLANGERVGINHRDSLVHPSTLINGKRFYVPYVIVLQTEGDRVIDRHISLPMIAQVVDEHRLNGH